MRIRTFKPINTHTHKQIHDPEENYNTTLQQELNIIQQEILGIKDQHF